MQTSGAPPSWYSPDFPTLVQRRERMPGVERLQTAYVRYKCQPEAQVTQNGWNLTTSQHFADQLAMEEQQPYLNEESLLYNGMAPTRVLIRVIEAPAEFAVPVKQDRRLTPNFKVRVEVHFRGQVSFPLTLKCYVVSQQDKDSIPEWVPEDFLDPDVPQKKPVTELKGTVCVTHHFEGQASPSRPQNNPLSLWAQDVDTNVLEQLLHHTRQGNAAEAAAAIAQLGNGQPAAALLEHLQSLAAPEQESVMHQDYEFSNIELVRPTRMNKVFFVFACSILEQDLMFTVYNIPTIGICRAEQRGKACLKLGLDMADFGYMDDGPPSSSMSLGSMQAGPGPLGKLQPAPSLHMPPLGMMGHGGSMTAGYPGRFPAAMPSKKRPGAEMGWEEEIRGPPGALRPPMPGYKPAAAAAVGGGGPLPPMQYVPGHGPGLAPHGAPTSLGPAPGGSGSFSDWRSPPMGEALSAGLSMPPVPMASMPPLFPAAAAGPVQKGGAMALPTLDELVAAEGGAKVVPYSRAALRELLKREYDAAGLQRRLTLPDVMTLESLAGFPANSGTATTIASVQWEEFLTEFRALLKLLQHISAVWNLDNPTVIAGFSVDRGGTVEALSRQPPGTFILRLSMSLPGSLVLSLRVTPDHPHADSNSMLHAIIRKEDLLERRLEVWVRDMAGATHVLDMVHERRVDKRRVFTSAHVQLAMLDAVVAEGGEAGEGQELPGQLLSPLLV